MSLLERSPREQSKHKACAKATKRCDGRRAGHKPAKIIGTKNIEFSCNGGGKARVIVELSVSCNLARRQHPYRLVFRFGAEECCPIIAQFRGCFWRLPR